MSWFSKYVAHPFVAAIEGLESNPAITSNPQAAAAVADAKKQAQTVASAATTATSLVLTDAAVAADPALGALTSGLTTAVDGFATATFGPVGGEVAAAVAGPLLTLGEAKAHDFLTALFAHLRAQVAAQQSPTS